LTEADDKARASATTPGGMGQLADVSAWTSMRSHGLLRPGFGGAALSQGGRRFGMVGRTTRERLERLPDRALLRLAALQQDI
jgi:hypothetical protein